MRQFAYARVSAATTRAARAIAPEPAIAPRAATGRKRVLMPRAGSQSPECVYKCFRRNVPGSGVARVRFCITQRSLCNRKQFGIAIAPEPLRQSRQK